VVPVRGDSGDSGDISTHQHIKINTSTFQHFNTLAHGVLPENLPVVILFSKSGFFV
jgi:hypothetical protein